MVILSFAFNTFTANSITLPGEVPVVSGDKNVEKWLSVAFEVRKGQNILNTGSLASKIPVRKHGSEWAKDRTC